MADWPEHVPHLTEEQVQKFAASAVRWRGLGNTALQLAAEWMVMRRRLEALLGDAWPRELDVDELATELERLSGTNGGVGSDRD